MYQVDQQHVNIPSMSAKIVMARFLAAITGFLRALLLDSRILFSFMIFLVCNRITLNILA